MRRGISIISLVLTIFLLIVLVTFLMKFIPQFTEIYSEMSQVRIENPTLVKAGNRAVLTLNIRNLGASNIVEIELFLDDVALNSSELSPTLPLKPGQTASGVFVFEAEKIGGGEHILTVKALYEDGSTSTSSVRISPS